MVSEKLSKNPKNLIYGIGWTVQANLDQHGGPINGDVI